MDSPEAEPPQQPQPPLAAMLSWAWQVIEELPSQPAERAAEQRERVVARLRAAAAAAAAAQPPTVWIAPDVRKARTVHCATRGCYTVAFYLADTRDDGPSAEQLQALTAAGWVRRDPDLLCPPHRDRW